MELTTCLASYPCFIRPQLPTTRLSNMQNTCSLISM